MHGAWPDFAFSQAHMDAAHEAVIPKFKKFWDSKQWGDSKVASSLKLNLTPDASPKLALLRYFRSKEEAAATAERLRATWKAEAERAAENAATGASRWSERLRGAGSESGTKQAVIFGAVALVALGALLSLVACSNIAGKLTQAQGVKRSVASTRSRSMKSMRVGI
jgi:hypothetical protein